MPLLRRPVRLGAAVLARLQHRPSGWSFETKQRRSTDGQRGDGRAPSAPTATSTTIDADSAGELAVRSRTTAARRTLL
eukprot:9221698-Heterocapsa_arctica.AAC.1